MIATLTCRGTEFGLQACSRSPSDFSPGDVLAPRSVPSRSNVRLDFALLVKILGLYTPHTACITLFIGMEVGYLVGRTRRLFGRLGMRGGTFMSSRAFAALLMLATIVPLCPVRASASP